MEIKHIIVSRYEPNRQINSHSHNSYEFVYYYKASGSTICGDNNYELKNDHYVVIPPNVAHSEHHLEKAHVFIMCFNCDEKLSLSQIYSNLNSQYILGIVQKLKRECMNKFYLSELLLPSLLNELIIAIKRANEPQRLVQKSTIGINHALSYINEYFTTPIDLKKLASSSGYCYDHFRLLFTQMTNSTPKNYILEKRLNLAKELLIKSSLTLNEICFKCGFEYYSQFSSFFKQHTKLNPKTYRQNAEPLHQIELEK